MTVPHRKPALFALVWWMSVCAAASAQPRDGDDFRQRLPQDEVMYFVLPDRFANGNPSNDRGGLAGTRLQHGFDPTHKGFYHGGDLAGLRAKLDYVQALGATAIWLGPIYRNKPVQGRPGRESAGYHGYWITDFTDVDPHFGTRDELKALVDAVHARGMKIYLDIITNHTADVIRYRDCRADPCPYRSLADYPYTRRGGIDGAPINAGFLGDDTAHQTKENFARLADPRYAYDAFVPSMLARAKARGIPNFHVFGEVYDPEAGGLARFTRVDRYPSVLDFAFQSAAVQSIAGTAGTDRLERLFFLDPNYEGGAAAALALPTFLGNHDMGRFAMFVRKARPQAKDEEVLKRTELAHALLFLARGVPVVYSGDEQGFVGDGGDQDARQPLFASAVASYNDDALLGNTHTTAQDNYAVDGPLFKAIARLSKLRADIPELRRGEMRIRFASDKPGLFAFSRVLDGRETLVVLNTSDQPSVAQVRVESSSSRWNGLIGDCAQESSAPGSVRVQVTALGYIACRAAP